MWTIHEMSSDGTCSSQGHANDSVLLHAEGGIEGVMSASCTINVARRTRQCEKGIKMKHGQGEWIMELRNQRVQRSSKVLQGPVLRGCNDLFTSHEISEYQFIGQESRSRCGDHGHFPARARCAFMCTQSALSGAVFHARSARRGTVM